MGQLTFQFATETRLIDIDSALIRLRTDCTFSHVDIVMPDGDLLGARLKGGVQKRKPGYAPFSKVLRLCILVDDAALASGYSWLLQQVGKPYDWRAIAGLALYRNWRRNDSWFCSELAFALLTQCKVLQFSDEIPDLTVNWLSPRDLILVIALQGIHRIDRGIHVA